MKAKKLLFDLSYLSMSVIVSRIFLFLRDMIIAGMLGPTYFGFWTRVLVVLNYALFLPLGMQNLTSRDVPFHQGAGNLNEAKKIEDSYFVISNLSLIFLIVISLFFSDYFLFGQDNRLIYFLLVFSVFSQQLFSFSSVRLRAYQRFKVYSIGVALHSILNFGLTIVSSKFFGLTGVVLSQGLSFLVLFVYWYKVDDYSFKKMEVDFHLLKRQLQTAFPLFLIGLSSYLLLSLDRLIVVSLYPVAVAGIYGFAFSINQAIYLILTPIQQALLPRFIREYGEFQDLQKVKRYFYYFTVGFGSLVAIMSLFLMSTINFIIPIMFKEYQGAIGIIKYLLVSSVFMAISSGIKNFLVSLKYQKKAFLLQSIFIVLEIGTLVVVSINSISVHKIAILKAIVFFIYSLVGIGVVNRVLYPNDNKTVTDYIKIIIPVVIALILRLVVNYDVVSSFTKSWLNFPVNLFFDLLIGGVLCLLMLKNIDYKLKWKLTRS